MRKWIILLCALGFTALADQIAKHWVVANLALYESVQPISALAPLFQLTRSSNTGAAFGILPLAGDVLLVMALAIIAGMLWYFRSVSEDSRLAPVAIGMIIGGALGNIADRMLHGHVIDFIHYQIPNLISNVSNLADHAIVLGVMLIVAESLWRERRASTRRGADEGSINGASAENGGFR
ncbi:MAG: signal peptidase II [Chloroflexi bacterium]|nr:signal peptidase II [Chloroflexota bacterium]